MHIRFARSKARIARGTAHRPPCWPAVFFSPESPNAPSHGIFLTTVRSVKACFLPYLPPRRGNHATVRPLLAHFAHGIVRQWLLRLSNGHELGATSPARSSCCHRPCE